MAGTRRYLFRKMMLGYTKGNGWYEAAFNIESYVRVYKRKWLVSCGIYLEKFCSGILKEMASIRRYLIQKL